MKKTNCIFIQEILDKFTCFVVQKDIKKESG